MSLRVCYVCVLVVSAPKGEEVTQERREGDVRQKHTVQQFQTPSPCSVCAGVAFLQYVDVRDGEVVGRDTVSRGGTERLVPGTKMPGIKAAVMGVFQKKDSTDGYR